MLVSVTLSSIFLATAAQGADTGEVFKTVVVEKGDTLWDIANANYEGGDVRQYIRQIRKVNNLSDHTIFEGETLKLPL